MESDLDAATSPLIPNLRHKEALEEASRYFRSATLNIRERSPMEIIAVELTSGLEALGEIVGETSNEEIYDRIFSQFCLGK